LSTVSRWSTVAVVVALLLLPLRDAGAQGDPAGVVLGPGDIVKITVWRQPEYSGEYLVGGDGRVAHPLYRDIRVTGRSIADVEADLGKFLRANVVENPQFIIEPLLRVAVGGEVRLPNLYSLRPELTVAQAISVAGGPNERARRDRVRVLRGGETLVLDLSRPNSGAMATRVRSGDQIVVERRSAVFREYVAPTITVIGAVAAIVNALTRGR
jgi:polysaccharide export outer membrane protein